MKPRMVQQWKTLWWGVWSSACCGVGCGGWATAERAGSSGVGCGQPHKQVGTQVGTLVYSWREGERAKPSEGTEKVGG